MASQADSSKSEPARPNTNAINHPYSSQITGLVVPPGPEKEKAVKCTNKSPGLPYEKLLMIAELLK